MSDTDPFHLTIADVETETAQPCVQSAVSVTCRNGHRHRREFLVHQTTWDDAQLRKLTVDGFKSDIVKSALNCDRS